MRRTEELHAQIEILLEVHHQIRLIEGSICGTFGTIILDVLHRVHQEWLRSVELDERLPRMTQEQLDAFIERAREKIEGKKV